MTIIVDCRARGGFSWKGNPEQVCRFETEHGWFIHKAKDIPWHVQSAVKTGGTVKAEFDPKPDAEGCIPFIRFIL